MHSTCIFNLFFFAFNATSKQNKLHMDVEKKHVDGDASRSAPRQSREGKMPKVVKVYYLHLLAFAFSTSERSTADLCSMCQQQKQRCTRAHKSPSTCSFNNAALVKFAKNPERQAKAVTVFSTTIFIETSNLYERFFSFSSQKRLENVL